MENSIIQIIAKADAVKCNCNLIVACIIITIKLSCLTTPQNLKLSPFISSLLCLWCQFEQKKVLFKKMLFFFFFFLSHECQSVSSISKVKLDDKAQQLFWDHSDGNSISVPETGKVSYSYS